jgi:hypothetical protein
MACLSLVVPNLRFLILLEDGSLHGLLPVQPVAALPVDEGAFPTLKNVAFGV